MRLVCCACTVLKVAGWCGAAGADTDFTCKALMRLMVTQESEASFVCNSTLLC